MKHLSVSLQLPDDYRNDVCRIGSRLFNIELISTGSKTPRICA